MEATRDNVIQELLLEAENHEAINHPYLLAMAEGKFDDMQIALADFAVQYEGYTSWFPRYLTTAMSKLKVHHHRMHLVENLAEEGGHLPAEELEELEELGIKSEWVQGIPHPQLFKRFKSAIGAHESDLSEAVLLWREMFLNTIEKASPAEAMGLIGLGTESIVKHVYKHITKAIINHTNVERRDYVFFELHSEIDDEHGEIMLNIAKEFLDEDEANFWELRKGMLKALNLRAMFWNDMVTRTKQYASRKEHTTTI